MRKTISVSTIRQEELIDITSQVSEVVEESGLKEGVVTCFVPHTTAGITINENADPSVVRDIIFALDRMIPDKGFTHREGNSTAHVKSSLLGSSIRILLQGGTLTLGTWQGIYFCEFDGPRDRRLVISVD